MMYQHLEYRQLIELVHRLCWERKSGFLFFSTQDEAWGKIKLHQGTIIALGYHSVWGKNALPSLRKIDQVKCFFQEKTTDDQTPPSRDPSLPETAEILAFLLAEDANAALQQIKDRIAQAQIEIEQEEALEKPPRQVGQRSILVADDSQVARMVIARPLAMAGYQVTEARDGYEAIGLAEDNPPDLLILDVNMPDIDGYKVLDTLRHNRRTQHLPIIMVTGNDGLFDRLKGKMADCQEYLTKPVDTSELLKLARKYIHTTDV